MLLIICIKYEKNPSGTVDATGWTQKVNGQTDMVNPTYGSNYAGYREYAIDELLVALEIILFHNYIQFNGCIFKQILGIPMGGNASPFIADLYLSWCKYCYMT